MSKIEELFRVTETAQETIVTMSISQLDPYPNQPFKLYSSDKLMELAKDIEQNGLLSPIVVRPLKNRRYQVLAGHNRVEAMKQLKKETVPAIVKECDDDEAAYILVQSNLLQRQALSPSEKANAYKLRYESLKKIRQRHSDKTSLETLAETESVSSRTIARYIRTTRLIPELMERFDNHDMSLPIAENLAGLSHDDQIVMNDYLNLQRGTPSLTQIKEIVAYTKEHPLTLEWLQTFKEERKEWKKTEVIQQLKDKYQLTDYQAVKCLEFLSQQKLLRPLR